MDIVGVAGVVDTCATRARVQYALHVEASDPTHCRSSVGAVVCVVRNTIKSCEQARGGLQGNTLGARCLRDCGALGAASQQQQTL